MRLVITKIIGAMVGHNNIEDDVVVVDNAVERKMVPVGPLPLSDLDEETNYISDYTPDYQQYNTLQEEEVEEYNTLTDYD